MQYQISCECGGSVTAPEAAAGTAVRCACGRSVVIPSLRELRRLAGVDSPPPPELVVETLLLAGKLPEGNLCALCGEVTELVVCCHTECERAYVRRERVPWWVYVLA